MNASNRPSSDPPDIPWETVVRFIRQLSHDLRNHLNAVELQAAFLGEIAADQEMKDEVKRLREMLSTTGGALQKLSSDLGHARLNPISYKTADFIEDVRQRIKTSAPDVAARIDWQSNVGESSVEIDPQFLSIALEELLSNAARFGEGSRLHFESTSQAGNLVLSLSEPKSEFDTDLSQWGREPLKNIVHGHYALGLNRARIIVESHGGKLEAKYDPKTKNLVTRIILPESKSASP